MLPAFIGHVPARGIVQGVAETRDQTGVALVTGDARGLGVEVCRQLAQAGMQVWCAGRDLERAQRAAESMRADGDVRAAKLDVADESSITALARRLERLDVLVNNAAIDYDTDARALTIDLDRVRRDLETNLLGAWRMAQAFSVSCGPADTDGWSTSPVERVRSATWELGRRPTRSRSSR